jgi:murein L,D-transpeptidase YafK
MTVGRRSFGRYFLLLAIGLIASAGLAIFFAPIWLPQLPGGDEELINYERTQRLIRARLGFDLPSEPDLERLPQRLAAIGVSEGAPVFIRIFKREFELELWMQHDGVFHRFAVYPICSWSGRLGPKLQQGDRQAPEGFYTVDASALNPNSRFHRSFNLGFPNAFDRSNGRTGSLIMVHGSCASIGCFAMTNAQIDEIWRLITAAFANGQKRFQVQVYPFRMSDERLAEYASNPDIAFWRTLKTGNDLFEANLTPPKVMACQGRYRFEPGERGSNGDRPIEDGCPASGGKG